jgi:hypothetical protein
VGEVGQTLSNAAIIIVSGEEFLSKVDKRALLERDTAKKSIVSVRLWSYFSCVIYKRLKCQ